MTSRLVLALAALLVCGGIAQAADGLPPPTTHEFVLGNPKAKVTVIEYASLTCPHCAHFQTETYPEIKKNYIDTGKIRFILRDFPLDGLAMAAAVLTRCVSPDKGHKLAVLFFENQRQWVIAENPVVPMKALAKSVGIEEADVDKCFENKTLIQEMQDERQNAADKIEATPAFFIGDENLQGAAPYEEMAAVIDRHLAQADSKKK